MLKLGAGSASYQGNSPPWFIIQHRGETLRVSTQKGSAGKLYLTFDGPLSFLVLREKLVEADK